MSQNIQSDSKSSACSSSLSPEVSSPAAPAGDATPPPSPPSLSRPLSVSTPVRPEAAGSTTPVLGPPPNRQRRSPPLVKTVGSSHSERAGGENSEDAERKSGSERCDDEEYVEKKKECCSPHDHYDDSDKGGWSQLSSASLSVRKGSLSSTTSVKTTMETFAHLPLDPYQHHQRDSHAPLQGNDDSLRPFLHHQPQQQSEDHLAYPGIAGQGAAISTLHHSPSAALHAQQDYQIPHEDVFSAVPETEGDPFGAQPNSPHPLGSATSPVRVTDYLNHRYHAHPAHQVPCQSTAVKAMNGEKGRPPTQIEIKKGLHTLSEQRRRWSINEGYEQLRNLVPQCDNGPNGSIMPKAAVLSRAANYIGDLTVYVNQLKEAIKDRDERIKDLLGSQYHVQRPPSPTSGYLRTAPTQAILPPSRSESYSMLPATYDTKQTSIASHYNSPESSLNLVSPASATFGDTGLLVDYSGQAVTSPMNQIQSVTVSPTDSCFSHYPQNFRGPLNMRSRSATFPAAGQPIEHHTQPEYSSQDGGQVVGAAQSHYRYANGADTAYVPAFYPKSTLKRKESPMQYSPSTSVIYSTTGADNAQYPNKRVVRDMRASPTSPAVLTASRGDRLPKAYVQAQHRLAL